MKIYFNFTDDNFREMWPKAMNGLRDTVYGLVKEHISPELEYYGMTITNTVLGDVYKRVADLSRTIGTFEYDSSDFANGNMERKIGRFSMELKVDEVIDSIGRRYNDKIAREKWLGEQTSEDRSAEALRSFQWDEFYPTYIVVVANTLRNVETAIWEKLSESISRMVIQIEKK